MPRIEIYTTQTCPYCISAKELLQRKGAAFEEIPVDGDPQARAKSSERAQGGSTVPQILIDNRHIGGCDDLYALDVNGALDPLLIGNT
ncbi:MAG: glutaredoxin 3, partial [Methylocystis sp.]